jgi:hypothetical protein
MLSDGAWIGAGRGERGRGIAPGAGVTAGGGGGAGGTAVLHNTSRRPSFVASSMSSEYAGSRQRLLLNSRRSR